MNTQKIIIADDHQIIIDGIKSMLSGNKKYEIVGEALNGQEAMDKITSSPQSYDILITDISMPLLSGIDLCKMVKRIVPTKKVIILSMYSSPPMVQEAIDAEADGFILKNTGVADLQKALHQVVNDSTYYSVELMPTILRQIHKEKKTQENLSILTEREREVLTLIVKEYTSVEIAKKLHISKKTVDNHRANILEKTNSKSTISLVKFALRNGIE